MIKDKLKNPDIKRAYKALLKMETTAVLYFSNGKLSVSCVESRMYERHMEEFKDDLIGVYSKDYKFDDVIDDIEEFLKENDLHV